MISRELEKLLALREIDIGLDDLHRNEHDLHRRLEEGKRGLAALKQGAQEEKKGLDSAMKEHKTLDLDLKQREEQVRKYTSQMYEVKTNKEYSALRDEIDKGKRDRQALEDKILALMIREDDLKGALGRRNAEVVEAEKRMKGLEAEVNEGIARVNSERERLGTERTGAAGELSSNLLSRYERIREVRGGSPLACVVGLEGGGEGACGECHMTVRPQVVVELYKKEELVTCESCGRILYLDIEPSSIGQGA